MLKLYIKDGTPLTLIKLLQLLVITAHKLKDSFGTATGTTRLWSIQQAAVINMAWR